ncbi:hypothetical protein ABTY61_40340 [Kitasatospora sp. NPDC096128]|uniref:hypothetical protein n=1 Tax=Kitasatospora sp. NPDC096128 TaxID=3155547 RepID=UPI00331F9018
MQTAALVPCCSRSARRAAPAFTVISIRATSGWASAMAWRSRMRCRAARSPVSARVRPARSLASVLSSGSGGEATCCSFREAGGDPCAPFGQEPGPQPSGLRESDVLDQALVLQPAQPSAHQLRSAAGGAQDAQLLGRGHPELAQRGDHGVVDLGRRRHHGLLNVGAHRPSGGEHP